jgi:hypothetical protein
MKIAIKSGNHPVKKFVLEKMTEAQYDRMSRCKEVYLDLNLLNAIDPAAKGTEMVSLADCLEFVDEGNQ